MGRAATQVMVAGAAAHPAEPDATGARNRTGRGDCPSTRQRPRCGAHRHPREVDRRGLGDGDGR
jgi:hypothetical protein